MKNKLTREEVIYILQKIGDYGNNHHNVLVEKLKNISMDLLEVENTQALMDKRLLLTFENNTSHTEKLSR